MYRLLTSPVDIEPLLPLLSLDGLVQQYNRLLVEALREALDGKVVVGQQQLSLGLQVHPTLLVMVCFVQRQQVVVYSSVEVRQTPM